MTFTTKAVEQLGSIKWSETYQVGTIFIEPYSEIKILTQLI